MKMLGELVERFLGELKDEGKAARTVINYGLALRRFVGWVSERGIEWRTLSPEQAKAFRAWLVERGLSPRSVNLALSALRVFYDWLAEQNLAHGNPFGRRIRVKEPKTTPRFMTNGELDAVLKAIENLPQHVVLAFKTMLFSGLRVAEAANLLAGDVLVEDDAVLLRVRGKGNKERIVPVINPEVARKLVDLAKTKRPTERLFGVSDSTLKLYAWLISRKTGIHFTTHRLRHTFATHLLRKTGIEVVQKVLGHANIATTRRYAETLPEDVLKLAARLNGK